MSRANRPRSAISETEPVPVAARWRGLPARLLRALLVVVGAAVLAQALVVTQVRPTALLSGIGGVLGLVADGLPPDPAALLPAAGAVLETVDVALVATLAAVVIAVPLAAGATASAGRPLAATVRGGAAFLRSIPDLVWALIFVAAVGLGPFAGVLALTVHSVGMLVRLFAETIDEMDTGPVDALTVTGAGPLQVFTHAVVPELVATFGALALYRMEQNLRASLVLGFVGAGGIGFQLFSAMEEFQYRQASTLLLMLFALVTVFEWASARVRRALG